MTSTSMRALAPCFVLGLALGLSVFTSSARAHGVVVDGASDEWFARAPNGPNLGIVARSSLSTGEFVWLDAPVDARTDLATPEVGAEIGRFAVTADRTNVYFLVQVGTPGALLVNPPQIQIAIDIDRRAGSGTDFLAGFADTRVADEARWEFLVQTQGLASARVLDGTFATVGAAPLAAVGGVVEIAVPWALLEGAGTLDVLRFSVATFREQMSGDTVDVGGAAVSNALDAVTDYGDPVGATGVFPNTFADVSDGILNHSIDVWFSRATREVYAPLQIVRFMSDAPAGSTEWIEIRNQTPVTLPLDVACLGDEETPDQAESMQCFPAGSTLASGAAAVVAVSGMVFQTAYGVAPDFEETATLGTVPDTARLIPWTSSAGAMALANGGDELVLLGFNRTILDVVGYGTVTYAGVTSRPAPGATRVATRAPVTSDTDNCAVDFPTTPDDCGLTAGTCGACLACQRFACAADVGASCDDADACTIGTTCSASATCTGGSPLACDDGNQCTTDACLAATGCMATPNPGALCDDGRACTTGDVCTPGIAGITCGGAVSCDDMNPCTADACDPSGACTHTPTVGIACDDGSACTSGDACTASGGCSGAAIVCPDDGNVCTTARCDPTAGCTVTNNTASCDDGDGCTLGDVCGGGVCSGAPRVCDDGNRCTTDSCGGGVCVFTPSVGTICDDGNACTLGDVCTAAAICLGSGACDAGVDVGPADAGTVDAGTADAGTEDAGPNDAGTEDAGPADAGIMEMDASMNDASTTDGGAGDTGPSDGGPRLDGGPRDAAGADAGAPGLAGGCGCRASSRGSNGWLALLGLAFLLVRRRR